MIPRLTITTTTPLPFSPPLKPLLSLSLSLSLSATPTPTPTTTPTTDTGLQFRRKLLYLESLNVNPLKALRQNPQFRSSSLQTLKSVEACLSSFGLPRSSLGRILDMYPQLLTSDPHLLLYPIFDFLLNDVQLPFHDVSKSIIRCPRLLVSSVDFQLRPTFQFLRKLGFRRIDAHTTVLLVSSVENTLIPKLEYLESLGFNELEVQTMVLRSPGLLTYSVENNFKPKVDYFVNEMKRDLKEIKQFPQYFSFSLEGKIKLRHRVLVEHGLSMPIRDMLKVSDGEFNVRLLEMRLHLVDHL